MEKKQKSKSNICPYAKRCGGCDYQGIPYEKQLALRGAAIAQLEQHIRGTGIVICLENLFSKPMLRSADGILELIEAAGNGPQLGVCLDIGHLHRVRSHGLCSDSSRDFIRKAGSRLKALHVHDNLGDTDDHLLPFVAGCRGSCTAVLPGIKALSAVFLAA